MQESNDQLKLWKVAIRELYYLDILDESVFISMYHFKEDGTDIICANDMYIIDMVHDTMSNVELMAQALHEEVEVIAQGIIPKNKQLFKKMWLSYLLDCHDRGLINEHEFMDMKSFINFENSTWTDFELETAHNVVDMIRFILIEKKPGIIEYIDNPSFDLLMYANNLEYV